MTEKPLKICKEYKEFYPKNYKKKGILVTKEKEMKSNNEGSNNKNVNFKEYFPKNRIPDKQVHPLDKNKESFYPKGIPKISDEKNEENKQNKANENVDEEEDDYSGLAGNKYYKNNKGSRWKNKAKKSEDSYNYKSKWKTEICHYWEIYGVCVYGDTCAFAHGAEELNKRKMSSNYKTKPCRQFFELGYCSYGIRCQFSHKELKECDKKDGERRDEVSYLKILSEFNDSSNQISHEIVKRPRLKTFEIIASCTLDEKEKNRLKLYEDILAMKKKENEEPERVFSEETNDENENSENKRKSTDKSEEDNKEKLKRERFVSI